MTVKLIDTDGSLVRTVHNVRGIEEPRTPHPASGVLVAADGNIGRAGGGWKAVSLDGRTLGVREHK